MANYDGSTDDFEMPDEDQARADRRLNVRFTMEPRIDHIKTAETGETHYRSLEFVTILIPGDKTLSVHRPVMPSDKVRFQQRYEIFKKNQSNPIIGTPLAGWPFIAPGQVKDLEYMNTRTVEELAGMSDVAVQNMSGLLSLRQKAQKFLEAQKDNSGLVKLTAELEQRDNTIAAMQDQINQLAEAVKIATKAK